MSYGTILYVEDQEPQRMALKKSLEMRNFKVYVAGDVETARSQIKLSSDELDVVALDMRLEDAAYPDTTGADVALEFFDRQTPWPPEFLIHSQYSEVEVFKLAMQLSAVYLHKSEARQDQVIRHIRALSIKRALSAKNPRAVKQVKTIVERTRSSEEALTAFCGEVLEQNFRGRLGAPFVLLLTQNNRTQYCAGDVELPADAEVYDVIQAMAFAEVRHNHPFVLDAAKINSQNGNGEAAILQRLNGAAFLPLSISRDLKVSLGILPAIQHEYPLAENPVEMAGVLGQYYESAILELFMNVLTEWAKTNAEQKEMLRVTSQNQMHIGGEQISILNKAADRNSALADDPSFTELYNLASDLVATGNMLNMLERKSEGEEGGFESEEDEAVSMAEFVKAVWEDMDVDVPDGLSADLLSVEGGCTVTARKEDLLIVVLRLLQWLAGRLESTPDGIEPGITVRCAENEERAELIFEDRSRRLDSATRERLFEPFVETVASSALKEEEDEMEEGEKRPGLYLPLYLAKMLVEVKYKGWLGDASDEMEDSGSREGTEVGHRLVMWLPKQ